MSLQTAPESVHRNGSDARRRFILRIGSLPFKPTARGHYVRWAESWAKARGNRSAEATRGYFDSLTRSTHLADRP